MAVLFIAETKFSAIDFRAQFTTFTALQKTHDGIVKYWAMFNDTVFNS